MARFRELKVHALGEMNGAGNCRTLCDYYMATGPVDTARWSVEPSEVTCEACRKVMADG